MRVVGVIEQDNNRFKVDTSFTASEMEVIVNAGLRTLLAQGQLPIRKNLEGLLEILSPSEAYNSESTVTGHRDGTKLGTRVGFVEPERGDESDHGIGLRPVLGSEVAGGGEYNVHFDPAGEEADADKSSQTPGPGGCSDPLQRDEIRHSDIEQGVYWGRPKAAIPLQANRSVEDGSETV